MQFGDTPPLRAPFRTLDDFEDFARFLRALPDALPPGTQLAIYSPSSTAAAEFRRLDALESELAGWGPDRGFLLPLTADNVERICALEESIKPGCALAIGIEAWSSTEILMSWHDWWEDPPWFSAAVAVERLQELALRCGGSVSDRIDRTAG